MKKVIGITGGIGSGKSTVTEYLLSKDNIIIDADEISRDAVAVGEPILKELVSVFGEDILQEDGALNRKALAARTFAEEEKTAQLNAIMHKEIKRRIDERLMELYDEPVVYLSAPLLFEAKLQLKCDEIWVVSADDDLRVRRTVLRDGVTEEDVRARMACQLSEEQRRRGADVIIENNGTTEELLAKIDSLLIKEYDFLTSFFY
ncbi:MAG: dephospho-CoA kinase [Clostridiales Family XIII bacterium]|jgi:dephospho-CoA kinase|nr:dephospho-CoA kinase [Clostridiales Family XIII bacterium]